jgi:acyl-CoA thioesterase
VPAHRRVHGLHAYFLRPGTATKPIVCDMDRRKSFEVCEWILAGTITSRIIL